jgi:hypothetical protein
MILYRTSPGSSFIIPQSLRPTSLEQRRQEHNSGHYGRDRSDGHNKYTPNLKEHAIQIHRETMSEPQNSVLIRVKYGIYLQAYMNRGEIHAYMLEECH